MAISCQQNRMKGIVAHLSCNSPPSLLSFPASSKPASLPPNIVPPSPPFTSSVHPCFITEVSSPTFQSKMTFLSATLRNLGFFLSSLSPRYLARMVPSSESVGAATSPGVAGPGDVVEDVAVLANGDGLEGACDCCALGPDGGPLPLGPVGA
jgi:hypothetical protein